VGQSWRVAVSTWVFADRPLFEALDVMHLLGAAALEVSADEAHLDPRRDLPDLKEVAAAVDRLGLSLFSLHAPFRGLNLAAPREEERRTAVATIGRALEVATAGTWWSTRRTEPFIPIQTSGPRPGAARWLPWPSWGAVRASWASPS